MRQKIINDDYHTYINALKGQADLIIADPWYGLGVVRSDISSQGYLQDTLGSCAEMLNLRGSLLMWNTYPNIQEYCQLANNYGLQVIDLLIWARTNPQPRYWRSQGYTHYDKDYCLWLSNNDRPQYHLLAGESYHSGIFSYPSVRGGHPCAKPVELMEELVLRHSIIDDLVIEPFGGSMPVLEACKRLHRNCVSFELDDEG